MKKLLTLTLFALALPMLAQSRRAGGQNFASDFQTLPVAANVPGVGSTFQSYVSVYNPTSSAFTVTESVVAPTSRVMSTPKTWAALRFNPSRR